MDLGSRNLPNLVSGKELAQCYGECKRLELIIHARQAGGRAASGRLKKHDSARLKCLQREVYPDLRIGKMPTELVWKMLRRAAAAAAAAAGNGNETPVREDA